MTEHPRPGPSTARAAAGGRPVLSSAEFRRPSRWADTYSVLLAWVTTRTAAAALSPGDAAETGRRVTDTRHAAAHVK